MKESLLHYIWEGLHFNLTDLKTICGKSILLCSRGIYNRDQGPDFSHGHIQIDGTDHFGNIELHVKSKEWYQHRHETDEKYNSVILHVVHESDGKPVFRKDGTVIPEIELKNRINPVTLKNYDALNLAESKIACGGMIGYLPTEDVREEFSRMGMMRIRRKAVLFQQDLQKNKMDGSKRSGNTSPPGWAAKSIKMLCSILPRLPAGKCFPGTAAIALRLKRCFSALQASLPGT